MSYTSQSTPSSYNQSPPADDGTETEANKINWSKIKTKLSDPLNTFATNINNAIVSAFNAIDKLTTEGDTLYRDGSGYARLAIGTAKQVWTVNSGATAPEWATPIFSENFTSSDQTITPGGSLTLPHGLSATPTLIVVLLVCKTAEFGYSVDDVTPVSLSAIGNDPSTSSSGVSIVPDATNLNVRIGSTATGDTFRILNHSTGSNIGITNASWRLRFVCFV